MTTTATATATASVDNMNGRVMARTAMTVDDGVETPHKLRMAELVTATGVAKSTILYYVAERLLPEPERPKPNVALYDPICVDVVRYIRDAQRLHRYPLAWIRTNVRHILAGAPAEDILHLGERVLGTPTALRGTDEVAAQLKDPDNLERYVALGLIFPTAAYRFDEFDLRMAELIEEAEAAGLPAEAFTPVAEALKTVEERSAEIAQQYIDNPLPGGPGKALLLVEVLGRLQPYLLRRYLERREQP